MKNLLKVIKALISLDSRAKMRYDLEGQKELDQDIKVQFQSFSEMGYVLALGQSKNRFLKSEIECISNALASNKSKTEISLQLVT